MTTVCRWDAIRAAKTTESCGFSACTCPLAVRQTRFCDLKPVALMLPHSFSFDGLLLAGVRAMGHASNEPRLRLPHLAGNFAGVAAPPCARNLLRLQDLRGFPLGAALAADGRKREYPPE